MPIFLTPDDLFYYDDSVDEDEVTMDEHCEMETLANILIDTVIRNPEILRRSYKPATDG